LAVAGDGTSNSRGVPHSQMCLTLQLHQWHHQPSNRLPYSGNLSMKVKAIVGNNVFNHFKNFNVNIYKY
jgi:hypothetical protein